MGKQKFLTEQQEKQIIYNYEILKYGLKKSGAFIPVGDEKVKKVLQKYNIHIRKIQETNINKYFINHNYFKIQSPDMAYWLGILSSDGCIANNENQIYIELQYQDKELLEKLNLTIKNERPVKDYITKNNYKNSKLYFYSKQIKQDLKDYHIIPNKTYNKDFIFPQQLNSEFLPDYIRGLFDGDGSIKLTNTTITWQIDCSSLDILKNIQNYLFNKNIQSGISTQHKTNIDIYRIVVYGKEKNLKIYNLLYNTNSNLFLLRKKEKFKQLLNL